jgi:hypothetical protein
MQGWWWWRNEGGRTKINCDVVDGGLKLRSPTKIMFDMNTYKSNNDNKNCIILKIFYIC